MNEEWTEQDLALLALLSNEHVAEMTGRSLEDIGRRRLEENYRHNNWPKYDPERSA